MHGRTRALINEHVLVADRVQDPRNRSTKRGFQNPVDCSWSFTCRKLLAMALTTRFHSASFVLGMISTLFALHAWQLYVIRNVAYEALADSRQNADSIEQIAKYVGGRLSASTSSASSR
jgi:uncharacterized membrane-anchored protein